MNDEKNLNHLLLNVSNIVSKYNEIARVSGENFNIFSIMSMEEDERYTHSAIIAELLNPLGSHGQGSVFLKLFLEELDRENIEFLPLNLDNVTVLKEEYIGRINEDYTKGGNIDVVIRDINNQIVIENKIYADDQPNQLIRYKNHYPKSTILYLTPLGEKPHEKSKGILNEEKDFYLISYKHHIKNWLEKCYKELVDLPIIRETIKQYITIVKTITNQTNNIHMSEEIIKLISNFPNESFEIANNIENFKNRIYNNFIEEIKRYAIEKNMQVNDNWQNNNKEYGLFLTPNNWIDKNINICVIFEAKNYTGLYYGVSYEENLLDTEKQLIREKFKINGFEENNWWIWKYVNKRDWSNYPEVWKDVVKGKESEVFLEIINGIEEIISIEKTE